MVHISMFITLYASEFHVRIALQSHNQQLSAIGPMLEDSLQVLTV